MGELHSARSIFERLRAEHNDPPGVRFSLAWLNALENRFAETAELIDDAVIADAPQAAALKVQALQHLDDLDGAIAFGRIWQEKLPNDDALLGALSVAAMDAEDFELAAATASRAAGGSDALTTRGLLALDANDPQSARELFEKALTERANAPRSLIGRGLCLLAAGDAQAAAQDIERGAQIFGDHLGSWISAGWAQLLSGDTPAAKAHFEYALSLDDNFGETHGALAVIDALSGDQNAAKRRIVIAQKLDRQNFASTLAQLLLLQQGGEQHAAQKLIEHALAQPAGPGGKTLLQSLSMLGTRTVSSSSTGRQH